MAIFGMERIQSNCPKRAADGCKWMPAVMQLNRIIQRYSLRINELYLTNELCMCSQAEA